MLIYDASLASDIISTHALREEGDGGQPPDRPRLERISTHALREEGDYLLLPCDSRTLISTHALREEGDLLSGRAIADAERFLPTPSARRATDGVQFFLSKQVISTHALREEGDC